MSYNIVNRIRNGKMRLDTTVTNTTAYMFHPYIHANTRLASPRRLKTQRICKLRSVCALRCDVSLSVIAIAVDWVGLVWVAKQIINCACPAVLAVASPIM